MSVSKKKKRIFLLFERKESIFICILSLIGVAATTCSTSILQCGLIGVSSLFFSRSLSLPVAFAFVEVDAGGGGETRYTSCSKIVSITLFFFCRRWLHSFRTPTLQDPRLQPHQHSTSTANT